MRVKTLVSMIWGTYLVMKHQVQMGIRFYRKGKKGSRVPFDKVEEGSKA